MTQPINKDALPQENQDATQRNKPEEANKNEIKNSLPDQQEGSMNNGVLGANFDAEAKKLNEEEEKG